MHDLGCVANYSVVVWFVIGHTCYLTVHHDLESVESYHPSIVWTFYVDEFRCIRLLQLGRVAPRKGRYFRELPSSVRRFGVVYQKVIIIVRVTRRPIKLEMA